MKRCHRCGQEWVSEKKQPAVKEFCANCSAYLHCCLNCRFHDPGAHNECYISTTEWVGDKAGCNFCDEFEFADADAEDRAGSARARARDKLEDLFGSGGAPRDDDYRSRLDQLFGD